jgi:hypothetical protein
VGTDYARENGRQTIAPIAEGSGLGNDVSEYPARIPYLHGLRLLGDAHFTVILGSDDPSYSPSKVYPYLLTGRPFVAVMHQASSVVPMLERSGGGVVATFGDGISQERVVKEILHGLELAARTSEETVHVSASILESVSARTFARLQCGAFDAALQRSSPQGIPCVE